MGIEQRTVGEPWGLTKEPWENRGRKIENRGDPQNPKQKYSKKGTFWPFLARTWPRGLSGHFWWREPWENCGRKIENRGTPKIPTKFKKNVLAVPGAHLAAGSFWPFWWREPWENRGGQIENCGDPTPPSPNHFGNYKEA